MPTTLPPETEQRALELIRKSMPYASMTAVVVLQHKLLLDELSTLVGVKVTPQAVARSLRSLGLLRYSASVALAGGLNVSPLRRPASLSAGITAVLACAQTWEVGHLAIAIAKNDGKPLSKAEAQAVLKKAREGFDWKRFPLVVVG